MRKNVEIANYIFFDIVVQQLKKFVVLFVLKKLMFGLFHFLKRNEKLIFMKTS